MTAHPLHLKHRCYFCALAGPVASAQTALCLVYITPALQLAAAWQYAAPLRVLLSLRSCISQGEAESGPCRHSRRTTVQLQSPCVPFKPKDARSIPKAVKPREEMRRRKICACLFSRTLRRSSSITSTDAKDLLGQVFGEKTARVTILRRWGFICIIDQIICRICHLLCLSSDRKQK